MLPKYFCCMTSVALGATLLLMLSSYPSGAESSRILAVYSFPGKSHFMMHTALIKELINRGHHVTMVTAFTLNHLKLGHNYTEILIEPVYDFWADIIPFFKADNIFELTTMGILEFNKMLEILGVTTTEHALKQPKVQQLINNSNARGQFDLLLCEQFYQEPFLALSRIYDIPVVTSSTLGFENHFSQIMGVLMPWAFVPHTFTPLTDRMTFRERVFNSYYMMAGDFLRGYSYYPKMDKLVEKYFGGANVKIPSIAKMEKNVSVILLNSHAPLSTARPLVPGMIPVGGLHIYPTKKLPENIQKFIDEASDGVIYFSLGSNVQSKDMPPEKLRIFLEVFATMKQRIVWKFEDESIKNLPKNILIQKWLPQSDILAHPNVKVFITHGGLFGTQEGVYHGVAMLGMPIYCDQHLNMRKAEQSGYAINLHFQSITKDILNESLQKLIYDPYYQNNVEKFSRIFRDRPMNSRDTAMYWIEYVIRHQGATHIQSAGVDLEWYQLYLLDVIAFGVGLVLLAFGLGIVMTRWLFFGKERLQKTKLN